MAVITLLTDFGLRDGYPSVMKGVIWKIAPTVKIVDLSHDVSPHDVFEAGLLLWRAAPYFPDGTVHVAVIDPGVGTSRRGISARLGTQYFVGPDNGIISMLLERIEDNQETVEIVNLDKSSFWLPEISGVFHGRDIFAPVSAHLSLGIPLDSIGTPIDDPIRLKIPKAVHTPQGWLGEVVHIDHFGNLATNLHRTHINQTKHVVINIKRKNIVGIVNSFGERPPGTLVALLDSSGSLAISRVLGNAAQYLHARVGDPIELITQE